MKFFLIILFFLSVHMCHGLKVLAIFPLSMHSHLTIGHSIAESLLDAGHEVTAITGLQNQKKRENYRVIQMPDFMEKYKEEEGNPFQFVNIPIIVSIFMMAPWTISLVNTVMQEAPELTEFLKKDDEKFDVCIIEVFNNEALLGIAEKYDCVLIGYTTFGAVLWADDIFSNDSPSSYVPHPFLTYSDDMNFGERFYNKFINLVDWAYYKAIHFPIQRCLYRKYFPDAKRSMDDMYKNYSIVFLNQHVSFSSVRPYLPTMIEIGGIHVKPAKKLPQDFQDFLDSATDGAILFSMGSYIDGTDWKLEDREAFVRIFGKLKQKIIWRYRNETLPGNPGNIKIASWLPQRDIMAHPNVKLFITHGGLLGTTEALVEGIPVLGIPIFGDQMMNMIKSVKRGYGLQVLYSEFCEEKFSNAIHEILSNPKYRESAKTVSNRFKDRPMTPQQTVAYYTEYVFRNHGAKHLRSAGNELNFIQLYSYDVFAVMALIFVAILFFDYWIVKAIIKKCFKSKKNVENKKKKN